MIKVYDIERIVWPAGERLDWMVLPDQAAEFGWDAALYESLKTALALFSTSIPEDVDLEAGYQISSPV